MNTDVSCWFISQNETHTMAIMKITIMAYAVILAGIETNCFIFILLLFIARFAMRQAFALFLRL